MVLVPCSLVFVHCSSDNKLNLAFKKEQICKEITLTPNSFGFDFVFD